MKMPTKTMTIWDKVTVTAMEVDAETACEWLAEKNVLNREMRERHVQELSALHEAGEFVVNGDTVRFATLLEDVELPYVDGLTGKHNPDKPNIFKKKGDEILLDGQNRLRMVYETEKPANLIVVRGLDPRVQKTMDQNTPRLVRDMMRCDIDQVTEHRTPPSHRTSAIGRAIMEFAYGIEHRKIIRQRVPDVINQHADGIDFVTKQCFKSANRARVATAPVFTVMVQAYYNGADKKLLVKFGQILLDGRYDTDYETAAVALRNKLLLPESKGQLRQATVYWLTMSALDKFLRRERVTKLFEASNQFFPLKQIEAERRVRKTK